MVGFGISIGHAADTQARDPNADQYDRFSSAERDAWDQRLADCENDAEERANLDLGIDAAAALFSRLREGVESDPGVVAAERETWQCVADRGYDFSSLPDIVDELDNQWANVDHDDQSAVEAVQATERAIAVAYAECAGGLMEANRAAWTRTLAGEGVDLADVGLDD